MNHHQSHNILGSIIGALMGLVEGLHKSLGLISIEVLTETSILAAIGAVVGFVTTAICKWTFRKIFKAEQ